MSKAILAIVGTLLLGSILAIAGGSARTLSAQATPEQAAPVVIASEVLGRAMPFDVTDPELALGRATIMPGAVIQVHHHPGTQIGAIVQGTLLFSTGAPRAIVDATPIQ
jgi:quercetin dioxygenase-like cupin family protein